MKLKHLSGVVAQLSANVTAAATGATAQTSIGRAPFRAAVVGAYWIPDTAHSGAATANRKLDILNKGAAGAGTAVAATITFTAAVDGVAYDANDLTVSPTAANVNLAEGDVVTVLADVNSTGLPLPAGRIVVELQAR